MTLELEPETEDRRPRVSVWSKVLLACSVGVGFLLLAEGATSAILAWRDAGDETGIREELHCAYDADLGWSHRKSVRVSDLYGEHRHLTTNARGFRALEEYTAEVSEGRYRIVCVGDSFTLGYGVDDEETYGAKLEALDPRIQAVNMGQGGYGVDQAWLWYRRDGVALDCDLLLFAFIAPDFDRMLEPKFNGEYSKPYLRAVDGELRVENQPVPDDWSKGGGRRFGRFRERLAIFEFLKRLTRRDLPPPGVDPAAVGTPLPYRAEAELLFRDLAALCRERGHPLVLLQLPLRDRAIGRAGEVSAWLSRFAETLDVPFLDLREDFDALPKSEVELYYQEDGHYNALGNRLVAGILARRLAAEIPDFPK